MQIVWDPIAVEQLRKKYTVLELETIQVEDQTLQAWCVLPMEKIGLDLQHIDKYILLHQEFVRAFKDHNQQLCEDLAEHLIGQFGGELDTFYTEILSRFKSAQI